MNQRSSKLLPSLQQLVNEATAQHLLAEMQQRDLKNELIGFLIISLMFMTLIIPREMDDIKKVSSKQPIF
jgi:hypothetical protein